MAFGTFNTQALYALCVDLRRFFVIRVNTYVEIRHNAQRPAFLMLWTGPFAGPAPRIACRHRWNGSNRPHSANKGE
jgi:hypothetical protein